MSNQTDNFQRLDEESQQETPTSLVPENIMYTYQLSKAVQFISLVDLFFNLLLTFINPIFLVLGMLSGLGYFGAQRYNKKFLWGFFSYQCLLIVLRFVYPFLLGDVSEAALATTWLMTLCIMALEGYLARFTYKFIQSIKLLSPEEHLRVQNIRVMNYQHIYW